MSKQTTSAIPSYIANAPPNPVYSGFIQNGQAGGPPGSLDTFTTWQKLYGLANFSNNIADITGTEDGKAKWTVLVPSDGAFEALGPGVIKFLEDPKNISVLRSVLQFHFVESAANTLAQNFVPDSEAILPELITIDTVLIPPNQKTVLQAIFSAQNQTGGSSTTASKGFSRRKNIF